ncbi:Receptor-interacting serine/threonine-protein kinase 2 [Tulasnella sp. 403]|nr:Receptor-interacting serine/threonine-protein kinase 2 [Tulasnella sp. 403]
MLVTDSGHVQLCDFDNCHPANDPEHPLAKATNTLQYRSPETMMDQNAPKTFKSDVYAFGMMIYEVLSGKGPFEVTTGAIYCAVLINKERPPQEPAVSPSGESYSALWSLAMDCWHEDPEQRPTMEDVVRRLKELPCHAA